MTIQFPPVEQANEDGLVAIGGFLSVETLVDAYTKGIFPWPIDQNFPMTWFAPDPRGILFTEELRINKSLQKFLKSSPYTHKFNTRFKEVMTECAHSSNRKEHGTWITEEIISAYELLFLNKMAYCVEVYEKENLVGGLYGVCIGNFVSGESMFYKKENASKFALLQIVQLLQKKGVPWLDTQQTTPVVGSMGGREIPRKEFMKLLRERNFDVPRDYIFP